MLGSMGHEEWACVLRVVFFERRSEWFCTDYQHVYTFTSGQSRPCAGEAGGLMSSEPELVWLYEPAQLDSWDSVCNQKPLPNPSEQLIINRGMNFKIYSGTQTPETQRNSKLQQQRWNLCISNFISHFICLGQYLQRGMTEYPHIQRCNACGITPQRTGVWSSCQTCWHFYFKVKNRYF